MRLKGKRAVVVGGGTGIGLRTAQMFAAEGASVAIMGRRSDVLQSALESIGAGAKAYTCDATNEAAVIESFDSVVRDFGGLDILVQSAGVNLKRTNIDDTDFETFKKTIDGNLYASFLCCREAARVMGSGGSIVVVGGAVSFLGLPNGIAYTSAKAGLMGMVRQMAGSLGPRNIRVNAVAPARVKTALVAVLTPEAEEALNQRYALGRTGDVDDVGYACLYLASDEAKWITGVVLPVDGGLTAVKAYFPSMQHR